MADKYLMFSLDDPKAALVADAINNKTCKKILEYLAEKEATESEISKELQIPSNTIDYSIKKLLETGLIEKTSDFFWSVKGKKMPKYKVSNKKIIISPKTSKMKNFLLTILLVGVASFIIKFYNSGWTAVERTMPTMDKTMGVAASGAVHNIAIERGYSNIWLWFLLGGLTALLVYLLLSWKKL